MRWRIYYGDGTTYDDSQGPAWDAPARNVQAIVVSDPDHGWYILRADDFYWYLADEDRWYSGDRFGMYDYLLDPGAKRILFGRSIPNAEYARILDRAMGDKLLPEKTGWRPDERRA
jgi:hypothetical protein